MEENPRRDAQPAGSAAEEADFRSGYVVICGYPNAGKSTLLNALLDTRLAIVTPKPQTTRRRTLGILTRGGMQVIFIDTPGILEPRYALQGAMMRQVVQSLADADLLLYVVDVRRPRLAPGVLAAARAKPLIIAVNKGDLLRHPEEGLPAIEALRAEAPAATFIAISALRGAGLDALLSDIKARLPRGPAFYPADQLTEQPERFFVAELIREAAFRRFQEEVPYSVEVELAEFNEQPGRKDLIAAIVWVETASQKGILIGKGGRAIRGLGQEARRAIETFLGRPVFLELRVKVQPHWRRDARALRRFGYPPTAT